MLVYIRKIILITLFAKQNNESQCEINIACSYRVALYSCTGCTLNTLSGLAFILVINRYFYIYYRSIQSDGSGYLKEVTASLLYIKTCWSQGMVWAPF